MTRSLILSISAVVWSVSRWP